MQAMILAAGYGTRLQPYTHRRPKPLFPLLNIPLLLLIIQRLQDAGCDHIIVNCHHLQDQVEALLQGVEGVYLQKEEQILGTGGGLRQAADMMRKEPLIVTNGDIYHTVDFRSLYEHHIRQNADITLAVHDFPRFNGLLVQSGKVLGFGGDRLGEILAFTGIHILDPQVLQTIMPGQKSCIIEHYKKRLQDGFEIAIFRVDDQFWTDMGTLSDYLELHGKLLTTEVPCWPQLHQRVKTPFFVDAKAQIAGNLAVHDWVCIGNAKVGENVTISRSVVWDGAVIADNSIIEDMLIT